MPDERSEEHAWMRAAQAGDADAYGKLFRRHHVRTVRSLIAMMGNEDAAREVAQEAWIKAWKKRAHFNFQSSFNTWMHRIAVNTALDSLRARGRNQSRNISMDEVPESTANTPTPAQQTDRNEQMDELMATLQKLPEDQRTALVLREINGYSYQEIADTVGCKTGTVMSRLYSARQKLSQLWNHKS
ncbi:MAG: sigma-70 family RNA polymerase sigma factor [Verrucomicrobiota bacterium]